MANWKVWFDAARPKTLGAGIAPVLMGGAIAFREGFSKPVVFFVILACVVMIQVATNFCNDYYDDIKGADTVERLGPTRATSAGLVSQEQMKYAFLLTFFLASLLGLFLVYQGGLVILLIGCVSIASGVWYTAGPYALGYVGLGEVFVLLFFGPVAVGGTYLLLADKFSWYAAIAGLAPGSLSVAILTVNNLRDAKEDCKTNKRTLTVRFGVNFAKFEYLFSFVVAALIPLYLFFLGQASAVSLLSSCLVIVNVPLVRRVWLNKEKELLNEVLASTGKITLMFGLIYSAGCLF